jgi:hypothetical protein
MITIKSNIEYLTHLNKWWLDETFTIEPPNDNEFKQHIDYAIETLKMVNQAKDDVWDEKRQDVVGSNGNDGLHYQ